MNEFKNRNKTMKVKSKIQSNKSEAPFPGSTLYMCYNE
jgi:hypothetical protein